MRTSNRITVKPPKFELYELVTLFWNGRSYNTKIVQRWYNPDDECWMYRVYGSEQLYTVDSIEPRMEAVG